MGNQKYLSTALSVFEIVSEFFLVLTRGAEAHWLATLQIEGA
jgi:hypothetical protein